MRLSVFSFVLGCAMQLVGCSTGAPRHEVSEGDSANQQVMEEFQYHYKYPHPGVTTDNVIFGFDGETVKVLLIERGGEPYKGCWAFPGGFLEMEESAEEGARRELMEETGLTTPFVKQFHAFTAPDRDPRERVGMDDAAQAKWFALNEMPEKLAFDHNEMLRVALEEINKEIRLETKDWKEMTKGFTKEEVEKIVGQLTVES